MSSSSSTRSGHTACFEDPVVYRNVVWHCSASRARWRSPDWDAASTLQPSLHRKTDSSSYGLCGTRRDG